MSSLEMLGFSVVWLVLLVLAGLVLLLYRQVEKAYRSSTGVANSTLPVGSRAPDVAVIHDGAIRVLELPDDAPVMLAFVSTSCDACTSLVRRLAADEPSVEIDTFALVTGEGFRQFVASRNRRLHMRWVASPADIHEGFGVSVVPTLYVVHQQTVLSATSDASAMGVQRLLEDARSAAQSVFDEATTPSVLRALAYADGS